MTIDELKKNLRKYAKAHKGDWSVYGKVKEQISRAAQSPEQYEALVKFYCREAQL